MYLVKYKAKIQKKLKSGEIFKNIIAWLSYHSLKIEKSEIKNLEFGEFWIYLQPVLSNLVFYYLKFDISLTKILLTKLW